jgi:hypothetical protein
MLVSDIFDNVWKIFSLNKYEQDSLKANNNAGVNGVLMGYCKLDKLAGIKEKPRKRKKLLLHRIILLLKGKMVWYYLIFCGMLIFSWIYLKNIQI